MWFFLWQIFDSELENLLEYNGFNDWLHSFPLYRGKKTSEDDDDDHRIVGKFKVLLSFRMLNLYAWCLGNKWLNEGPYSFGPFLQGSLKVWKYPLPEHVEMDPIVGTFLKLPSNEPVNVLVRVYVIKVGHYRQTFFCMVNFLPNWTFS